MPDSLGNHLNIEGPGAINNAGIPQEISGPSFDSPPKNAGNPCASDTVLINKSHISSDAPRPLRKAAENSLDKTISTEPEHVNLILADSRQISKLVHLVSKINHSFGNKKAQ